MFLLFTSTAFAETDCNTVNEYSKMTECHRTQSKQTDKELNSLYQSLLKSAQSTSVSTELPNAYQFIKQNQRDWLKYALNYCDASRLSSKKNEFMGSFYSTAVNTCFTDLSKTRINQLKSLKCEEGDMSSTCLFY